MTTPPTIRKKLIEVALPLDLINENAAQEKDVHVGTLSNMHTWWSRNWTALHELSPSTR